eukprot:GILJ01002699.1.p1 GENE.GILJ01002699.1~~GILJ01002699.1.p1  ORF type:complete len:326 (-),score=29.51 GILJ01002699.1:134-1111(-)
MMLVSLKVIWRRHQRTIVFATLALLVLIVVCSHQAPLRIGNSELKPMPCQPVRELLRTMQGTPDKAKLAEQRFLCQESLYVDLASVARRNSPSDPDSAALFKDIIWSVYEPVVDCRIRERFGSMGDGGKWLCNFDRLPGSKTVIYSFGARTDLTFDTIMTDLLSCESHAFDPTLTAQVLSDLRKTLTPFNHFHAWGLGPRSKPFDSSSAWSLGAGMPLKSLRQTMQDLGHSEVHVLKIDIEGSEWTAFEHFLADYGPGLFDAIKVQQISVELHLEHNKFHFGQLAHSLRPFIVQLQKAGYYMFAKESNIYCEECMELSFIHKSLI